VRIAPHALATATLGAAGLAFAPYILPHLDAGARGMALALLVAALVALCRVDESVTPRGALDAWGQTVLLRSVRSAWTLWALLFAVHVAFWANQTPIDFVPVGVALAFVLVAGHARERVVWILLALVAAFVAISSPVHLASIAILASLALTLRASGPAPMVVTHDEIPSPYRAGTIPAAAAPSASRMTITVE
jgi:hypothetical protein